MKFFGQPDFQHGEVPAVGVLLSNLGTPDAPTTPALRRYLREFLLDPRVIEMNRALWWTILHVAILPRRPKVSAALYQNVWTAEGSPLLVIARRQLGHPPVLGRPGGAGGEGVRPLPGPAVLPAARRGDHRPDLRGGGRRA